MSSDPDNGFLSRWSRKKRAGHSAQPERASPKTDVAAEPADLAEPLDLSAAEAASAEDTAEDEAEVLDRLGLPDPDTLEQGDDFSVFMARAVPDAIRKRALRRLWRSNPTLAVLDGLNDYDDDFTGGFVKPGSLKTLYEVGKGLVSQTPADETGDASPDDLADSAVEAAEQSASPSPGSAASVRPPEPRTPGVEEVESVPGPQPEEDGEEGRHAAAEGALDDPPRATRRRMAFRFDAE